MLIKKSVIFTGYECNNHCQFCIDINKRDINNPTNIIIRDIYSAKKNGAEYLEIIGGEVTIRDDFFLLLKFIKKLKFKTVMFATNGIKLADEIFCKKMVDIGVVDHIVFSIHGHNSKIHDSLVCNIGALKKILKGIENLRKLGFDNIGVNHTIVKQNYIYLPEFGKFLNKNSLSGVELIFADPNQGGVNNEFERLMPRISEVAPYAYTVLDYLNEKKIKTRIRYVPLCYFEDYIESDNISELMEVKTFKTEHIAPDFHNEDATKGRQITGRVKPKKCKSCKYYLNCEGIWRTYFEVIGDDELIPVIE